MSEKVIKEPARDTPVIGECDVLVAGGGSAGLAAAASAARNGARVILVERYGYLTGLHASARVGSFCGFHINIGGRPVQLVKGIGGEILDRLKARKGLGSPHVFGNAGAVTYDPFLFKIIAEDLALEAGVQLLLHTLIVDVIMDGQDTIKGVVIESKAGRGAILARMFVDCTGDADLAARAGAPCRLGRNGETQYPSHNFHMGNVNIETAMRTPVPDLRAKMEAVAKRGELDLPRTDGVFLPTPRPGEVMCNLTRVSRNGAWLNGLSVEDLTYAEVSGKRQVQNYGQFLRKYIPGFEAAYIEDAGQIGIRQTRMIDGEYVLTTEDVLSGARFEDAVVQNAWCIERHEATQVKIVWLEAGDFYEIPYRCLVPLKVDNLLVAGRCIATEYEAQASARVTAQCFAEGQAAGLACVMSMREKSIPRKVDALELRKTLNEQGAGLDDKIK